MKISDRMYHGVLLFKKHLPDGATYDWADLAQWERDVWAVRQDYETAGFDWRGVVDMTRECARLDVPRQRKD
jgi:hypothetical protein